MEIQPEKQEISTHKCMECGKPITNEEYYYYGLPCDECEGKAMELFAQELGVDKEKQERYRLLQIEDAAKELIRVVNQTGDVKDWLEYIIKLKESLDIPTDTL